MTYLPTPLVLITELDGSQNVYIAPEAYDIAQAEFADQLEFWEEALPDTLKGNLRSLSGARVLLIDGEDPFVAVNANTLTTGGYQSFGTRQNSYVYHCPLGHTLATHCTTIGSSQAILFRVVIGTMSWEISRNKFILSRMRCI